MTGFDPTAPKYRYFVTDILSNSLIAEIPFSGVTYERSLKSAGKFSGNIPVLDSLAAMNLYDNTLPGRTALYIVRNDECVWGGIIWSRSYDVLSKTLSVQGSEFTSYLFHRNIWRTFTHDFTASASKSGAASVVLFTLENGTFNFTSGSAVRVYFSEVENFAYSGYYDILANNISDTTFAVSIPSLPVGAYTSVTVMVRVDTYDYTRQLLSEMQIDFSDIEFPNSEIKPGIQTGYIVNSRVLTNGVMTLTTATAHDAVVGQTADIRNISTTRTNLVTNPSFETNSTGWASAQSSAARSTLYGFSENASYRVVMSSTADSNIGATTVTGLTVGSFAMSLYVYIPEGSTLAGRTVSLACEGGTATVSSPVSSTAVLVAGAWSRCSIIYTVSVAGTAVMVARLSGTLSTAVGQIIHLDAVLAQNRATVEDYFDGSTSNLASWTGTANNSTSTLVVSLSGSYAITGTTSTTISFAVDELNLASAATTPLVVGVTKKALNATTGLVNLTTSTSHGFLPGQYVSIVNVDDVAAAYPLFNGLHQIHSIPSATKFTYYVYSASNEIYEATVTNISHPMIERTAVAFGLLWYYCDSVVPFVAGDTVTVTGVRTFYRTVTHRQISGTTATLTLSNTHSITVGSSVTITDINPIYNGEKTVTAVGTYTISYTVAAGNVEAITLLDPTGKVSREDSIYNTTGVVYAVDTETKKMFTILSAGSPNEYTSGGEVSGYITVTAVNAFEVGDKVAIIGVTPSSYDSASKTIKSATASTFVVASSVVDPYTSGGGINLIVPLTGEATVRATLALNTYGPFPGNADIGIEFSTNDYSGVNVDNKTYRGYELRSIGEELDEYSDTVDGFEYRIDCAYDPTTSSFSRTFVLLPINFPNPPAPGEISPLSRFGADRYVFEYPGNINNVTVDESAENAATRFFVVGNISDLGSDASQPYSVASATDLIAGGWPILDGAATRQDAYLESQLYGYAQRYLSEFRPPVTDIKISVNGSLDPAIGSYNPGDWCAVIIYDPFVQMRMSSDLEIRDDILVRKIENISVSVPDGVAFPEQVELLLFAEWEVDKVGE